MVNQDDIINRIDRLSLDNFPKTLMLISEYGGGKHTIVNYISNKLNLEVIDISNNINYETITDITLSNEPKIYIIETKKLTVKNENVLLKFLEEPLDNSFIILLCENKQSIIKTILNRCQVWELNKYTPNQLKEFTNKDDELLFEIAKTPGQIKEYENVNIEEIYKLCNKIFDCINRASYPNTLTLSNKFYYKETEEDKINFDLFMKTMIYTAHRNVVENKEKSIQKYKLTNDLYKKLLVFNVNKQYLFENYLLRLKQI